MHFEKNDIEEYLQGVWSAIDAGKYQIAPRPKNRELLTEYVISEKEVLDINNFVVNDDLIYSYNV